MFSNSRRAYSLYKFVNLFIYIFFILANGVQYGHDSNVLTFSIVFNEFDYLHFQVLLLIILIIFNSLYHIRVFKHPYITTKSTKNISSNKLIIISSIATIIILAHYHFNLFQLFARGLTESMMQEHAIEVKESSSVASDLLFSKIIRSFPWACFVIGMLGKASRKKLSLLFILMIITVFPTGLARNAAAMYWIPILILLFSKQLNGNKFILFMLISLFVIFPFLDNFRHFNGDIKLKLSLSYLDSMNLDASQIFMATIKTNTITYGNQLLGALFFFIPRSLWSTKPVGSGHYLVTSNEGWFTNVSMPFFSEGYINFGYIGIFVFVAIFALMCSYLDDSYWKQKVSLQSGYYLIILGAIIFIMRGDLMSSFAFTVGISITYKATLILCNTTNKHLLLCQNYFR